MMMHVITLLFCCLAVSVASLRHSLCTTSTLLVRGRDVVAASRGSVLVAVFMPLQCASCHRQLKRLSYMASRLGDVRVVVVAPSYEAPVTISRIQNEFPRLVIDRDVDKVWRAYEASNHDQIVFDRCSRVAHVLSHPRSDMTSYRDTLDAIDSARDRAPCGPCQHDETRTAEVKSGSRKTAKSVDAFVKMSAVQHQAQQQRQQQQQQHHQQQQQQQQQAEARRYEEYRRSNSRPTINVRANYNHQRPEQDYGRQQQRTQMQMPPQQQQNHADQRSQQTATTTAYPHWNRQQNINYQQPSNYRTSGAAYRGRENEDNNPRQPTPNFDPRQNQPNYNHQHTSQTTTSTTSRSPTASNRGYGPDEDYEDDLLPAVMTTPSVQTQIPYPTQFDPLWPTPAPGQFFHSDPRNPKKIHDPRFTKFGEQASENNIPCSAYTDDICYQQQEKFGREGLSKCCQRGIYLTDVCVPGKCSNHTVQLCCFQKFLQARYACCENDEQSLGPASTNDFSMCCHDNFVNDDECCGKETAANYWRSVHEVCYPNTKVDYSGIRMEVRFAEGVRVVDMNENRVWDYVCRNGGNRTQYAYIP